MRLLSGEKAEAVGYGKMLGGESYLHIRLADETLVIKTDGEASPRRGDRVEIALPPAQCHLFDAGGRRISARRDAPAFPKFPFH